jgi:hypothetical protein
MQTPLQSFNNVHEVISDHGHLTEDAIAALTKAHNENVPLVVRCSTTDTEIEQLYKDWATFMGTPYAAERQFQTTTGGRMRLKDVWNRPNIRMESSVHNSDTDNPVREWLSRAAPGSVANQMWLLQRQVHLHEHVIVHVHMDAMHLRHPCMYIPLSDRHSRTFNEGGGESGASCLCKRGQ